MPKLERLVDIHVASDWSLTRDDIMWFFVGEPMQAAEARRLGLSLPSGTGKKKEDGIVDEN